jgi:hypothetical protein
LKLIDFGLAQNISHGKRLQGWVGTPNFQAPEMRNSDGYDFKVYLSSSSLDVPISL